MICTSCSRAIRPIVAVDLDGTLGMYHDHFRDFAQEYWKTRLRPGYTGQGDFGDWMGLSKPDYREAKLAYRQGGGKRTMPAYPHATEFVQSLHDMGAEVWLTTTRPYLRLDSTDPDTRFWLEHNNISYDFLLYDDDKYEKLHEYVDPERVVMVLDDLPEQVRAADHLFSGQVAWMIQRTSNTVASHRKVRDLKDATFLADDLITQWRIRNGIQQGKK